MFQLPKNEHATLPSVENWYTNTNILKLPAKSIQTRRRDKVGDDLQITDWIDDSGDRVCEGISKFAKSINPMVSVSYGNYNAGSGGNPIAYSGKTQASLPRKAMDNGAFRAPIRPLETLLPLSRMPAKVTMAQTHLSFPNSNKRSEIQTDLRAVKKEILQTSVRPTAYLKLETPACPNYDVGSCINDNNISVSANSGVRMNIGRSENKQVPVKEINAVTIHAIANSGVRMNIGRSENNQPPVKEINLMPMHAIANSGISMNIGRSENNQVPVKEIDDMPMHATANTAYGSNFTVRRTIDDTNVSTEKYIQDALNSDVRVNVSNPVQNNGIYQMPDKGYRDDILSGSYTTGIKGSSKYMFFDETKELERNLPNYNATTNVSDLSKATNLQHTNTIELVAKASNSVFSNPGSLSKSAIDNISSRQFYLPPSLQKGGFNNSGFIPNTDRQQVSGNLDSMRTNLKGVVNSMKNSRFE